MRLNYRNPPDEGHDRPWRGIEYRKLESTTKRDATNEMAGEWAKALESVEDGTTVATVVDDYIDRRAAAKRIQSSTVADYRYSAVRIKAGLGRKRLCDLTTRDVQSWVNGLQDDGLGPSTVRKSYRLLHLVCEDAAHDGRIRVNPCYKIEFRRRKTTRENSNPLDAESLDALNAWLDRADEKPDRFVVAVELALQTGMRRGEVCGLRWGDVDTQTRVIHIRNAIKRGTRDKGWYDTEGTKNYSSMRDIEMPPALADVLDAWHDVKLAEIRRALGVGARLSPVGYILADIDGKCYCPAILSREWTYFARRERLTGTKYRTPNFKDLRHTWGAIGGQGQDIQAVSANLGHSKTSTTQDIYGDAMPDAKRAVMIETASRVRYHSPNGRVIGFGRSA